MTAALCAGLPAVPAAVIPMTVISIWVYICFPARRSCLQSRRTELKWSRENAEDYEFPDSWHGKVYFIRCVNPPVCDRRMRSIQCRTYPLAPHIDDYGRLSLIYNVSDLPYVCPLIEDKITLNRDFIQATYTVWKHLIRESPYL